MNNTRDVQPVPPPPFKDIVVAAAIMVVVSGAAAYSLAKFIGWLKR